MEQAWNLELPRLCLRLDMRLRLNVRYDRLSPYCHCFALSPSTFDFDFDFDFNFEFNCCALYMYVLCTTTALNSYTRFVVHNPYLVSPFLNTY